MKMSPEKLNTHSNTPTPMPQMNGKKILAGALLLILAVMWIRVFFGKSDTAKQAEAAVNAEVSEKPQENVKKFKRLKLPFESGRHDRLTTDMFASRGNVINDGSSRGNKENEKKIKSQKDAADKLAKKVELDAIILGADKVSHQAFINGKLQFSGDILEVRLNDENYELEVVEIFHNKVILKWNEYTISVRMAKLDKGK